MVIAICDMSLDLIICLLDVSLPSLYSLYASFLSMVLHHE